MVQLHFLQPKGCHPEKPLFVFLPGMDGTGELFYLQIENLAKVFDIRCLKIPPDDFSDWNVLCDEVISLIMQEELLRQIHRPVYLCGESFGGCLAVKVALESSHSLVSHLILVNPATCFQKNPWLGLGIPITATMPELMYQMSTLLLLPYLVMPGKVSRKEFHALLNAIKSVPTQNSSWRLSLMEEFQVEALHLGNLTQKLLIIVGAQDRLLPSKSEAQRLLRIYPQAKSVVLPRSGHVCLLEQDIKLYEILKAESFLPY